MPGNTWLTFPDGTEHALTEAVTIGRDIKNDLTLSSPTVSREHALLAFREGRWFVEDRGSYNGTFLNGTRVQPGTPLPLRHADRIGIGTETVLFSWPSQVLDPDKTETLKEIGPSESVQLSAFQRQVVQCLWRCGASTRRQGCRSSPPTRNAARSAGWPGKEAGFDAHGSDRVGNPGFPQGFDPSFLGEIVEQKLQPLGVIARRDQDEAELRRAEPLLALTFRAAVIPFRVVNGLARRRPQTRPTRRST